MPFSSVRAKSRIDAMNFGIAGRICMKKTAIYELAAAAVMAALLCVIAPLSIPIGPVPISLATLVLYLSVYVLRLRSALAACAVYLLLGAFGLPVFAGFSGGFGDLAGPTGGFLIGYLFLVLIAGLFVMGSSKFEKPVAKTAFQTAGMILGTVALYAFGTIWFMIQAKAALPYALTVCVVPFLPGDFAKIVVALTAGKLIRRSLLRAGLLS